VDVTGALAVVSFGMVLLGLMARAGRREARSRVVSHADRG